MIQGIGKGRTFLADTKFYLEMGNCLYFDRGHDR